MLDEVDDGFDFVQGRACHVGKPTELLRASSTHALCKIESDAVTGAAPLIAEVALGLRQAIDQRSREEGKPPRMLVGLEISKEHGGKYEGWGSKHHRFYAAVICKPLRRLGA